MQSLQEIEQILINAKINPNAEFTLQTDEYVLPPPAPPSAAGQLLFSPHFT
jgi:hypothetical protein